MICICARCRRVLHKPAVMRGSDALGPKCAASVARRASVNASGQLSLWSADELDDGQMVNLRPGDKDDFAPVQRMVKAGVAPRLFTTAVASVFDMGRSARQFRFLQPGRHFGERHHRARLTDEQCEQMREMRFRGASLGEIANKFGTAYTTVKSICSGRTRSIKAQMPDEDSM